MKEKELENPFDYKCKDKFLIQWIPIENDEKDLDANDLVLVLSQSNLPSFVSSPSPPSHPFMIVVEECS